MGQVRHSLSLVSHVCCAVSQSRARSCQRDRRRRQQDCDWLVKGHRGLGWPGHPLIPGRGLCLRAVLVAEGPESNTTCEVHVLTNLSVTLGL